MKPGPKGPRKLTKLGTALLIEEAERRARGLATKDRRMTKDLAAEAGVSYGYAANVIAKKRREIEARMKVDVPRITSTANVNSQASEVNSIAREL